ncbi:hypothetical protein GGR52DRAFT_473131 [Hypoxylon sp. FL1284]|nr:hypothetical protein GGR52DRAFT_473131 [Hypoxylon sp. FL1284]
MAHLPEGWEADHDGTRWLYRFTTTGLTQYHFPRPGDEYPELVGLGFEPLDAGLESKLAGEHQDIHKAAQAQVYESYEMSATGYFDPDDFITSISQATPVGFVAELANNDTAQCAEELAPVELDATQIVPTALQTTIQQHGTQKISVEQGQPAEHPVPETTQPIEECPFVSAINPTDNERGLRAHLEQKALASQQPTKDSYSSENGYEIRESTREAINEVPTNINRSSIAISGVSALQPQMGDLGLMEQKRYTISGFAGPTIPNILETPSYATTATWSTPRPRSGLYSLSTALGLKRAMAIYKSSSPDNHLQRRLVHGGVPGSGAKHQRVWSGSKPPIVGSNSPQVYTIPRPAKNQKGQRPLREQDNDVSLGAQGVNTTSPCKTDGSRIQVSHETTTSTEPTFGPSLCQDGLDKPDKLGLDVQDLQVSGAANNSSPGSGQIPGKLNPQVAGSPPQEVNTYHLPQESIPALHHDLMLDSISSRKLIRKPVLPQRPEKVSYNTETPMGLDNNPIRLNNSTLQHGNATLIPAKLPNPAQTNQGSSNGQHNQAHIQRPSAPKPPAHTSPGQNPPNGRPATQGPGQLPSQSEALGPTAGPVKPQNLPSPVIQTVSPLQSQVSSPSPSVVSIYRPPSSASSPGTHISGPPVVAQSPPLPLPMHQTHPHDIKPTAPNGSQQAYQQAHQPTKPPPAGPPKPFPMLQGQVTSLPSQVGSASVPMPTQPANAAQAAIQHLQSHANQVRPPQQAGGQPAPQTAMPRPPQQQPGQVYHTPTSGGFMLGQPVSGVVQQGQSRPSTPATPTQQYTQAHSHPNAANPAVYTLHGLGQASQVPSGQPTVGLTQSAGVQGQLQTTLPPNLGGLQVQQFLVNQQGGLVQGHQQYIISPAGQYKPFNSTQAAAALTDAGKKMKKWAKKTWQNPAIKQTTAVMGGAVIAGSLGVDGMAGVTVANQIYNASQATPQNGQPQRPPGPQHSQSAPPQAQSLPGTVRPQLQQMVQPAGVQTPGRPPAVQNPGTAAGAVNNPVMQQQPQVRPNTSQQYPYQVSQPPTGRPPVAQPQRPQQPTTVGQPVYQRPPNQSGSQPVPVQPLQQVQPSQPNYQAQGGLDPYAAVGVVLGNAVNALATGGNNNDNNEAPSSTPQQEQTTAPPASQNEVVRPDPQYTGQPEQQQATRTSQQSTAFPDDRQTQPEQQRYDGYVESPPAAQNSFFAPQPETVVMDNTLVILSDAEYTTAAADATQQMNTVYMDSTQATDTRTEVTGYAGTGYVDAGYADPNMVCGDAAYGDTNTGADAVAAYVDPTPESYADDAAYMADQTCATMTTEESVAVDATAYADVGEEDYADCED